MNKKNKKLTPKQQKALDRKLRSQYANKPAAVAAKRPPMPLEKKWLLGLIALVIVLAVVTATLCGVDPGIVRVCSLHCRPFIEFCYIIP